MSITTTISKPLESGFVQVDVKHKGGYVQYYKVPQVNARKFSTELKKQTKDLNIYSNIVFFSSILVGVFGASHFTKNFDSRLNQFLVQTLAAIGLSVLTSLGFNNYAESKRNDLIDAYKAKEIFYRA